MKKNPKPKTKKHKQPTKQQQQNPKKHQQNQPQGFVDCVSNIPWSPISRWCVSVSV